MMVRFLLASIVGRARHAHVVKQHIHLHAGASAHLQVGDRILLLATHLDDFLEVSEVAEASNDAQAQMPPPKRYRGSAMLAQTFVEVLQPSVLLDHQLSHITGC